MNAPVMINILHTARKAAKPISQFTNEFPDFSVSEAYQIQKGLVERALSEGDAITGFKMGLTSKAKQRDVQVFDTIRGVLLASFELKNRDQVATRGRIHPRVEPEIAVVFKRDFTDPETTRSNVVSALEGIYPALEIVDSRYENFKFQLADVIADNTSASGYMIGKTNLLPRLADLNFLGVVVKKNGTILETGAPAAVLGDPMLSVMSLIDQMRKEGTVLKEGMVILTGGITNSVPFVAGDFLSVEWSGEALSFKAI